MMPSYDYLSEMERVAANGRRVAWRPFQHQALALSAPQGYDLLLDGPRGGGKTDVILMLFAQHVGKGYGASWTGAVFRRTYPELEDLIRRSRSLYGVLFPGATFNISAKTWTFPGGEQLKFRHVLSVADCDLYQGHEYPFIWFDEATKWAEFMAIYESMRATNRSSNKDMTERIRGLSTNPNGPGNDDVKTNFVDHCKPGCLAEIPSGTGVRRIARLRFLTHQNAALMEADPEYFQSLAAISDPELRKAWFLGDWNINSSGMFSDIWTLRNEQLLTTTIPHVPKAWSIMRAYDDGYSHPFSLGWWAIADGETPALLDGVMETPPRGSMVLADEWYGAKEGTRYREGLRIPARTIAKQAMEQEAERFEGAYISEGPADNAIFNDNVNFVDNSIASAMEREGLRWRPSDKSKGSRAVGWSQIRGMLENALNRDPENPWMLISRHCKAWVNTVPKLQRDAKNADDVDKCDFDHAGDMTRYAISHVLTEYGLDHVSPVASKLSGV